MAEQPGRGDVVTCPHCEARRPNSAERCWLCGLYPTDPVGTVQPIERFGSHRGTPPGLGNIAALGAGMLVLMVAASVLQQAPGVGILLIVVVVPALIALGVTLGREQSSAGSFGSVFAILMFSTLGIVWLVVVVAAAAVTALIAFCSQLFPGAP